MEWEKRNTVGKDRVDELKELYESLGFDVKIERYAGSDNADETCNVCFSGPAGEYYIIYTKRAEEDQNK